LIKKQPFFSEKIYSKIFIYVTLSVVICILILSSILYINFEKIALSYIHSSVKDSLSQVSYSTKYMTDSVKTLCTQIYFESDISKLHSFASIELLDESNALRKLRSYKSTTPFVHSIYIHQRYSRKSIHQIRF